MTAQRIGKLTIREMVRGMLPKSIQLFPAAAYRSSEAIRARASEAMQDTDARYVTRNEPEGVYVIRLR